MINSGGGRDGGNGGQAVVIPEDVMNTILSIREITGKQHSDEDIYTVLQDCAMDPDETAQRLLYIDTFHEVKSKRDRRKGALDNQGWGARGGRGNYSGAAGRRNAGGRKENGFNSTTDRNASRSMQKKNYGAATPATKPSATPNGPSTLPNGSSILGHGPQMSVGGAGKDRSAHALKKSDAASLLPAVCHSTTPVSVSGVHSSSSSDPILAPSQTQGPGAVGTIKHGKKKAAGQKRVQGSRQVSTDAESELHNNEKAAARIMNSTNEEVAPNKSKTAEKNLLPESVISSDDAKAECNSQSFSEPTVPNGHVYFPNHLKVPKALKSGLTFGSFDTDYGNGTVHSNGSATFGSLDTNSGPGMKYGNGIDGNINSAPAIDLPHQTVETAGEPSPSNGSGSSFMQVDHSNQPESPQPMPEAVPTSEGNITPNAESEAVHSKQDGMVLPEGNVTPNAESEAVHSKQDGMVLPEGNVTPNAEAEDVHSKQDGMLFPEGHQISSVQIAQNYGFGIMPPMQGAHLVQFEGHETQAQDASRPSSFVNENSMASSSPSLSQPVQNSLAASPHPLLFRPPYPPNYLHYSHYYNPYFLPPMHQFLNHNGLSQQLSNGDAYLTPASTAPGVKFSPPQFKTGTNAGNPTSIDLQTLYGSYGSSPIGFNSGAAVTTTGSAAGSVDLSASQLKERNIYTTGPLCEVSSWVPPPGQDISSMQLNSLYHLHPQGQHLTFSPSQASQGPFAAIYPPVQTMTAPPSTVNPLVQQSQAMSAAAETAAVLHPGAYQQPRQLPQVNWNSAY